MASRVTVKSMDDLRRKASWSKCACDREEFIERVRQRGSELYRELDWRGISDPYGVLVSEVMLQQTQVARVRNYWPRWMAQFPTVDALAAADSAAVLEAWQGLGYNRRALALKRACETCSETNAGTLPRTVEGLMALPGIGPATAAGVVAFAFNEPAVYVETNVRSVLLHELFPQASEVADRDLVPYVADTCPSDDPRSWYYALLDYGAHLKAQGVNPSRRSKHYARQSAFEGSRRQKRSFILKQVLASPDGISREVVARDLNVHEEKAKRPPVDTALFDAIVSELAAEGFFHDEGGLLVP